MLNGGVQSFNFHASHHMIPHSLRTSVQFVELSIEDFVPRGRKQREKDPNAGGPRKLTEREQEIVRLVRAVPHLNPLKDRVNKFFVSPVYQVKHSKRSCLLMDCLQTLGIRVPSTIEEGIQGDKVISESPIELPMQSYIPSPVNEIQVPTSPLCVDLSDDSGSDSDTEKLQSFMYTDVVPSSPSSPLDPDMIFKTYPKDLPSPKEVRSQQSHPKNLDAMGGTDKSVPYFDHDGQEDGEFDHLENIHMTAITNKGSTSDHMLPVRTRKAKVFSQATHQHQPFPAFDQPDLGCFESPDQLQGTGSHGCRYRPGDVSVTQSGLVSIASPPSLSPPKNPTANGLLKLSDHSDIITLKPLQHRETEGKDINKQRQAAGFSPRPNTLANHNSHKGTPDCHLAKSPPTVDFVEDTPDEEVEERSSQEATPVKGPIQARVLRFEELSPRLAEFANHGVVPSTPGKEKTPVSGKVAEFTNQGVVPDTPGKEKTPVSGKVPVLSIPGTGSTECHCYLPFEGQTHIPTMPSASSSLKPLRKSTPPLSSSSVPAEKDAQSHGRPSKQMMGSTSVSGFVHPIEDVSPQPRMLTKVRPLTLDDPEPGRLPLLDQSISGVNNTSDPPNLEGPLQGGENHTKAKVKSPQRRILTKVRPLTFDDPKTGRLPMVDPSTPGVYNCSNPPSLDQSVPAVNTKRESPNLEGSLEGAGKNSKPKVKSPQRRMLTKVKSRTFNDPRTERLPLVDRAVPGVNNCSNIGEPLQGAGHHSKRKGKSPLQIRTSQSSGEDWHIKGGDASGSSQKPRKLKRLRRAREKITISVGESLKRKHNLPVQAEVKSKVNHSTSGKVDKHRTRLAARSFIDEEAEVSSDDGNGPSSGEEEYEDEGSSLEGFIDTAATQQLNGSVDMINIYRKSLLTPSPLGYLGAKQINIQQQNATPSSDVTPSSIEPSLGSRSLDDLSDFSTAPSVRKSSFLSPHNNVQTTGFMDHEMDCTMGKGQLGQAFPTNTALGAEVKGLEDQDRKKADVRKRKLSFQSSPTYEDDLFEGVDLDALEAEATEMSRMRSQAQVICSNAAPQEQNVPRTGSRLHKDAEFQFMPSFDLGLGD
ncbi:unnamed protein product [Calypogeia fissa]